MEEEKVTLSTTITKDIWSFPSMRTFLESMVLWKPGRWVACSAVLGTIHSTECQMRKWPGFQERIQFGGNHFQASHEIFHSALFLLGQT